MADQTRTDTFASLLMTRLTCRPVQVLENLTVDESLAITAIGVARQYTVRLRVFPDSKLPKESNLTFAQVGLCLLIAGALPT